MPSSRFLWRGSGLHAIFHTGEAAPSLAGNEGVPWSAPLGGGVRRSRSLGREEVPVSVTNTKMLGGIPGGIPMWRFSVVVPIAQ
jgi:hypothetical protein